MMIGQKIEVYRIYQHLVKDDLDIMETNLALDDLWIIVILIMIHLFINMIYSEWKVFKYNYKRSVKK